MTANGPDVSQRDDAFGTKAAVVAADFIRSRLHEPPGKIAIVLGSGLGGLARRIESAERIEFRDIPGFPESTVVGHAGALICGRLGGKPVMALSGRFHVYEGHDARLAAFPIRVLHALGARTLIVSNAAGGVNRLWRPTDLMLIRDHINLTFRNPLIGAVEEGDLRFPDMSEPYDSTLADLALEVASKQGLSLREGVYAGLLGPAYETPAEVRMLERLGADAVGMSTVPEVIVARARGMRVLGISCITNMACGISSTPLTHDEVLESTRRVGEKFSGLVEELVRRIHG
jgi:purine-nucleoside phosphorylase